MRHQTRWRAVGKGEVTTMAQDLDSRVLDVLRSVMDPELGVNIVDLGLVYGAAVTPVGDLLVEMTMTTPVCPLSHYLRRQVHQALSRAFPEMERIKVQLVWDPPWHPSMMSAEARRQLGWQR